MILDGVGGQLKAPRDLFDGAGLLEKAQYVELARGELVPGGHRGQQLVTGGRLQDDSYPAAAEWAGS